MTATTAPDDLDLAFTPAARQVELVRSGRVTARRLAETYLDRIDRLDGRLGAYRAVRSDRALEEADAADARIASGESAPLLGLPVAVKDNLGIAGELTTQGTGLAREPEAGDAELVRRLRAAGAVVLGITNMPELALWPHDTSNPTWGPTRNPWDLERSPGGSSGGSAAAVAAGLAAAALGTDGGGSIRVPAACCGLVGLKPQRDRLPIPHHWHGLTHAGPLTRTVEDAALLVDALSGSPGLVAAARRDPGSLRVAVSRDTVLPVAVDPALEQALERTATLLRELGHETVERDPDYPELRPHFLARYAHGAWLDARALGPVGKLEPRARTMPRLGRLLGRAARRAEARGARHTARIGRVFDECDVLLVPTTAAPAPALGEGVHRSGLRTFLAASAWGAFTPPWNVTGQPAISLPAGFDEGGVPLGAMLVGRPDDEATIVSLAAQLERARPWTGRTPAAFSR
jgi:amidase